MHGIDVAPLSFASPLASVTKIANTGISVKSRQIPANAKTAASDSANQCLFNMNDVAGTRQRSSLCRKLPIQNGLSVLRTVGTQRTSPAGLMPSAPGAGYPHTTGRITRCPVFWERVITGANSPGASAPPPQGSGPWLAASASAMSCEAASRR